MDNPITFQDIIRNNFLKSQEFERVTLNQVLIAMLFAFAAGMFIYLIYRVSDNTGAFVNSFAVSLVALTMITTLVIMIISSNLLLSLGMVGALSIVRFRTAVKEAIDIIYMFWAIAIGIAVGAGFYFIATASCLIIGVLLFVMSRITSNKKTYVLVINTTRNNIQPELEKVLKSEAKKFSFRGKSSYTNEAEFTYEVRLSGGRSDFTDALASISGVESVSLVAFKSQSGF